MDKQIMINGVDVNRCIDFNKRDKVSCYHILYDKCNENPNCYFKQLARSTQRIKDLEERITNHSNEIEEYCSKLADKDKECEELKERLERIEEDLKYQCVECMNVKSDRYLKALEEIQDFRKKHCDFWCEGNRILDIINKAKGEEK